METQSNDESPPPQPPRAKRPYRKGEGGGRNKLDLELNDEQYAEYLTVLRRRNTTAVVARRWLAERGVKASPVCVSLHRNRFLTEIRRAREAAELAHAFVQVARESGEPAAAAEAATIHVEQHMMQALFDTLKAESQGTFEPERWQEILKAIGLSVKNRAALEALRADVGTRVDRPSPSAEARQGRGRAMPTTVQVADRVREALGLPPAVSSTRELDGLDK